MATPHHIKRIEIRRLFGRYSYVLPSTAESLSDLNIIYGENGVGKTTLLTLVFHLISPNEGRGHLDVLSKTKFESLAVELNDGTLITAVKDSQLLAGPVQFEISAPSSSHIVAWKYSGNAQQSIRHADLPDVVDVEKIPKDVKEHVMRALEQRDFYKEMAKLKAMPMILTSDRIFMSDAVEPIARENRWMGPDNRSRARLAEIVVEYRNEAVSDAMQMASNWLQRLLLDSSYGAGESTIGIYEEVVSRIANTAYKTSSGLSAAQQNATRQALAEEIEDVLSRSRSFAQFGLARRMLSDSLATAVASCTGNKLNLINSVLKPHLAELKSRLDKIGPVYNLILNFVLSVNRFLIDKKLTYTVRDGLKIFVAKGDEVTNDEITPSQLSSGEKQLVLIFCHVLTVRNSTSIFIVDEPEISLNITWQRMLVSSLQGFSKGSNIQFIFASHSMEILAKHEDRVISLQEA